MDKQSNCILPSYVSRHAINLHKGNKSYFQFFRETILTLAIVVSGFFCMTPDFGTDDENVNPEAPVISIVGPQPYLLNVGDNYVEWGATAWDKIDGDLSSSIATNIDEVNTDAAGAYVVTYSVSDNNGNSSEKNRTVKVTKTQGSDTEKPVLTLKGANPDTVAASTNNYDDPGASAYDNEDGDISSDKIVTYGLDDINASETGTYTLWYMVEDNAGNIALATRKIVVLGEDTEPPVITLKGNSPMSVSVGHDYEEPGATAHDNVDGVLTDKIQVDNSSVNTDEIGTYQVVYTVSDAAGNRASKTRTVKVVAIVIDTTAPVITLNGPNPAHVIIGKNYVESGATAIDDIGGDLTAEISIDTGSLDVNKAGTYYVVYSVSDAAGNKASIQRRVNVWVKGTEDLLAPVVTLIGGNVINLGAGYPYNEQGATAVDKIDGDLTNKIVITGKVCTLLGGTYTLTYSVSDKAGNLGKAVRTVNVSPDTDPPVLILLGQNPMTLKLGEAYDEPGATAEDNVDGDITVKIIITGKVDSQTEGDYTITYSVSDTSGNKTTATRRVRVINDTEPPVITLLGAETVNLTVGFAYNEPGATAKDNIDGDLTKSIAINNSGVNTSVAGTYKVTYNVSDTSGNKAVEKVRTVQVNAR